MNESPRGAGHITNILIVDDHPMLRRGIRQILERHPLFSVVGEAGTAQVALQLVSSLDVDVVLMDIRLPDSSGIAATRRIKEARPNVKVIIFSAFGREFLAAAIDAGADGYLLKTASQSALVSAVRRAITGAITVDPALAPALFMDDVEVGTNSSPGLYDPVDREDGDRADPLPQGS